MPAHAVLCYKCAELYQEAYEVKELANHWESYPIRNTGARCEHCGKRLFLPTLYELTLKRNGENT